MSITNLMCIVALLTLNLSTWGGNYAKPEVLTNLIQLANYKYVNIYLTWTISPCKTERRRLFTQILNIAPLVARMQNATIWA